MTPISLYFCCALLIWITNNGKNFTIKRSLILNFHVLNCVQKKKKKAHIDDRHVQDLLNICFCFFFKKKKKELLKICINVKIAVTTSECLCLFITFFKHCFNQNCCNK